LIAISTGFGMAKDLADVLGKQFGATSASLDFYSSLQPKPTHVNAQPMTISAQTVLKGKVSFDFPLQE
jgi:hypothetical protein